MSPGGLERWREKGSEWQNTVCPGLCGERVGFRFLPDNPVPYQPIQHRYGVVGAMRELCLALGPPYRGIRCWGCWRLIEVLLVLVPYGREYGTGAVHTALPLL